MSPAAGGNPNRSRTIRMTINRQAVLDLLSGIALPSGEGDIVSSGVVTGCAVESGRVSLTVRSGELDTAARERLRRT
ncbi:MAG: iron-sulfur cluster assembly protein, partial [Phycisphaerales bacterium]|nr:iron-sulfur cluster assembly protein [Phycisphaerales bacterium]